MRLTIIPSDGAVYGNGVCYSDLTWEGTPANVHALQWDNGTGWIEFNDGTFNEDIETLPLWAANAELAWTEANTPKPPKPPTAEQNKGTAMGLLQTTDWVNEPDVIDPARSPHLTNQSDFLDYRSQVRQYAVYPVAGEIIWPVEPKAIWA